MANTSPVCRANSFKRFAARPECVGSIHNAHRIHSGRVANLLKLLAPKHSQRAPRSHSQRAPNTLGARCEFSHNIRGALRIFWNCWPRNIRNALRNHWELLGERSGIIFLKFNHPKSHTPNKYIIGKEIFCRLWIWMLFVQKWSRFV